MNERKHLLGFGPTLRLGRFRIEHRGPEIVARHDDASLYVAGHAEAQPSVALTPGDSISASSATPEELGVDAEQPSG